MCVTFHPFSDGGRHSRPSVVFMRHSNRIWFKKKEQKSVQSWFRNFQSLPHVIQNLILLHQGIVRSLFLYIDFHVEMFLTEMYMSESQ